MDANGIQREMLKFKKARNNLLILLAFTVVNLLLAIFNSDIDFLFSAFVPILLFDIGRSIAAVQGSDTYLNLGIVLAFVSVLLYYFCWRWSEQRRNFMLVAFIFFSIDSLIFLLLSLSDFFDISSIIDMAFHGWALYYLILGVTAWSKLRGIPKDVLEATVNPTLHDINKQENREVVTSK